jgi:hypothetical protein
VKRRIKVNPIFSVRGSVFQREKRAKRLPREKTAISGRIKTGKKTPPIARNRRMKESAIIPLPNARKGLSVIEESRYLAIYGMVARFHLFFHP